MNTEAQTFSSALIATIHSCTGVTLKHGMGIYCVGCLSEEPISLSGSFNKCQRGIHKDSPRCCSEGLLIRFRFRLKDGLVGVGHKQNKIVRKVVCGCMNVCMHVSV